MFFGDGQSNSVIQIYPRTLPGCHGNKIWDKMGYNSVFDRDICDVFASILGVFGVVPSTTANKILPRPTFVASATKFETKEL